jgi:hypothetical protein
MVSNPPSQDDKPTAARALAAATAIGLGGLAREYCIAE